MSSSTGPNNPGGGGDAHQPPPPPQRSLASTAAAMAAAAGASYHGNQLVFVVNPLPSTEEQLNERILDSAERLRSQSTTNAAGSNNSQTAAPNPIPGPSTSTAAESVEQQQQQQMPRPSVLQCVISHGYVAVLLEDHRVCRFQYNIYPERIANAESSSKSSLSANNNNSSGGGSHRLSSLSSSGNNSLVAGGGSSSARTVQTARRRLIRHSARGPRGGPGGSASATAASVIMGHRGAVIPAQFVPEDLINQAQVVLQGKSRNVIIRELQRTNLDVNLAVNNLLSRDDEEYDDGDDGGPEQMIQSDDLMSLLDSGFGPNESVIIDSDFADEVFSYPLRIRSSSSALFNSGSSGGSSSAGAAGSASGNAPPTIRSARESRLRDEAFSFIERDFMSGGSGTGGGGSGSGSQKSRWYSYPVEKGGGGCFDSLSTRQRPLKTSSTSGASSSANDQAGSSVQLAPISFADQGQAQEFWPTGDVPDRKFVAIASLTSELIAITAKGELCQWRWADAEPFRGQLPDGTPYWHPRAPALGLMAPAEKVTLVAGSCIRATVATESGKLATWIDESIAPVASKLEHPATSSIFEGGGSLGGSTSSLQSLHHHHHHHHHQLHHQQQQGQHRITSLHVSSLMSVVQLSSGAIYWWGVPPFAHRKKLVEKVKNERNGGGSNSASKSASKSSSKSSSQTSSKQQQQEEIVLGSLVCMRNSPLYQAGSIAFTTVGGLPKVGQLVNSAWKITDSCSFRVLSPAEIAARAAPSSASIGKASTTSSAASASTSNTGKTGASASSSEDLGVNKTVEMPPPPSPASSTSSEPGGYSSGSGPLPKRAKRSSNNSGGSGSGGATAAPENSSSSSSRSSSGEGANQQQGAQAIDRVEMWSLKDIVFMEDVRNLPVGRVIKVDGNYVAVKFTGGQGTSSSSSSTMLGEAIPPGSSLGTSGSSSTSSTTTTTTSAAARVSHLLTGFQHQQQQEHSLLFQAAMMGGGDQRGGNSGGSFSPGGPRSSSSQGGGGGGGGSSASSTDSMKTGAGGGGSQAAESFTFENFMQDCRLMRKDELTVVKPTALPTATSTTTSAASTSAAGASASTSAPSVQGTTTSSAASPINITGGGNGSSSQQGQQTQQQQQTGAANPLGSKAANDCLQRAPKRVHLPENVQILAMTLSNLGLHCIAKIGGYRFSYILVNIVTGRVESDAKIPIEYSTFFGSAVNSGKVPVSSSKIALYSAGETDSTTVVLCRDGNGTLYPLAKDCTETLIRDPIALNLGPVSTIGLGIFGLPGSTGSNSSSSSSSNSSKTHAAIVGLAFEPQLLMSAILKSDLDLVRARLEMLEAAPAVFGPMVGELCDGNHNILHIAVSACFPTSNKTGGGGGGGGGNGSSTSSTSSASTTSASSGAGASAAGAVSSATTAAERLISNMFESDEILNLQVMSLDQAENSSNSSSSNKDKDTSASTEQQQQSTPMDTSNSQTQQTQQQNHHHQHHNSADYIAEPPLDPSEQKPIAHSILWTLLDSPALQPYLLGLLSARDFNGLTPFMFAVSGRAYSAAIQLLLIMQRVARQAAVGAMTGFDQGSSLYSVYLGDLVKRTLETMLYPRGSLPDHSPLYMLCSNDTCSFTWTGEEHINQDIFECRTCGLVGSLCCCTECARVCHRGHDCKLKRTSPTAYCDCWEKCKCKALIGGCQPARFALLKRLLEATDLSLRPNARGEHLLLFLVQTVGRQIGEQRQYRPARVISGGASARLVSSGRRMAPNSGDDEPGGGGGGGSSSVPDHDLEPPKFARRALETLLGDWATVKSMILTGYRAPPETFKTDVSKTSSTGANSGGENAGTGSGGGKRRRSSSSNASTSTSNLNTSSTSTSHHHLQLFNSGSFFSGTAPAYALEEENAYLGRQNGSALLDKFTHSLLRIGLEMIERLIGTLLAACSNQLPEAKVAARRFVRSVARVGLVVAFELNPTAYASLVPMMNSGGGGLTSASIAGIAPKESSSSSSSSSSNNSIGAASFGTMMEQALSGSRSANGFPSYLFSKRGKGSSSSSLSSLGGGGGSGASASAAAADTALAILGKCRRIFVSFLPIAIEELCEVAESLVVPVKRGLARPSGAFVLAPSSSEVLAATEELFNVDASVLAAHQQRDFLDSAFGLGEGAMMELGVPPPPPVVLPAPVPPPTTSSLVMMVPPPPAPQQIHPQPVIVPPPPQPSAAASTSSASNFSGAFPAAASQEAGPSGLQQQHQQPLPPRVVVDASVINEEAMDTDAPGGEGRRSPSAQELLEEIGAGMEEASSEAAASSSMDGSEAAGPSSRRHQMNALLEDMLADEDSNAGGGGNNRGAAGGNGGNQDHPHHHQLHHHHHHHLHPHGNVPGGGGADSDSDSSSSNPDDAASYLSTADNASMAQRSVVTGATAGSDVGVSSLPYDDESVNSPGEEVDDDDEDDDDEGEGAEDDEQQMRNHHHHHHQGGEDDRDEDEREEGEEDDRDEDDDEDEDDEDGGSDASDTVETENEGDEIQFIDDGAGGPLEAPRFLGISTGGRGGGGSARSNILHHVQWALRQRGGGSGTGSADGTANAVSSISASLDPSSAASFRRAVAANQQANALVSTTGENVVSMANSAVGLARAFSIVIRQIGDLMPVLRAGPGELAASGVLYLAFTSLEAMALQNSVEERLKGTWEWLIGSLDSTETQLRFGCALSNRRLTSASISPISVGGGGVSASAAASISHAVAFSNSSAANSGAAAAVSAPGAGGSSGGVGAASLGGSSSSLRRLRAFQAASAATANSGSSAGGSGAAASSAAGAASADADLLFLPALSRSSHSSSLRRMSMVSGGGGQNASSSLATRPISPGTSGGIRVSSSGGGGGGTSAAAASSAVAAANTLSATDSNSSRRDFLNYAMSLMRAHSNEHYDSLPVLDVASLKHLAYVFDAFIYYMRRGLPADPNQTTNVPPTGDYQQHPDQPLFDLAMVGHSSPSPLNNAALAPLLDLALICPPTPVPPKTEQDILEGEEPEQRPVVNTSGRKSRFFRRSASTLYLGCPPPDPFSAPFYEALPLASKPHLLTPSARREQLFGVPRPSSAREAERLLEALPAQMSLTRRTVNGGSGSSSSSIFADGGQISSSSSAPAATPIPKASTSTSSNIIQNSPSGGKPSVIVLAGSAKHPKLGTSSTSSSNDPQMSTTETESSSLKSTTTSSGGYMSVIAKAGQYNAAHADVKSLMANHYYGSLERHDALLGRWRLSLELFGRLFVDDVGLEPGSIMPELSGFPVKETKFRREMERLRNPTGGGSQGSGGHGHHGHHGGHHHGGHHSSSGASSSGGSIRDLFLKVDRDRALLLAQTFKELNAVFASHTRRLPSNSTPSASSLAITRVKVTFREEPGEGSGVVRGFYTAFSEAVLANEKLPALDWLLPGGPGTGSGGGSSTATSTTASSSAARSSSTGYGTGSGSPSSSAFASNHFNLIRATNMAINVGLSSPSSSLAQAVSNALQAESGGGGRGGSGSPGGSSSAPPSAAASGSSTPSGGAEELLRRPRSPSRPRYAGGLSSSRRSHIERIRHELRNSALEDFRRSSRSSPYGSSAGQSPPASSSSSSASISIPIVLSPHQAVQHVPIIQPIPSASSASMLSMGSGGRHRSSSSGTGSGSSGGPVLRYDSPAFVPTAAAPNGAAALLRPAASSPMSRETETRNALGSRIYSRVFPLQPSAAGKITGMLLDLPSHDLLPIITSEEEFRAQVEAAMEIINAAEGARSSTAASGTPPPSSSSAGANPSASSSASTPSSPPEFEAGFIDALLSAGLSQQAPPPPASVAPAPSMLRLSDFDGLVVSGGGRDPRESSGSGSSSSQPVSFPDHHHLENHVLLFPPSSSSAAAATTPSPSATSASSTSTAFPPLPPPPVISTLLPAEDNAPLFYQPGPRGFYSPRLGRGTEARLNAFRNVGRIIGICFVQNELCPITLNRHVIKYILGRPIGWHDLAFFDPDLYESLRQLILDAESPGREEVFAQLDFRFSIDLSREEGGGEVELLPGGRHLRVTPANVLNYVQRYAMQRMLYSAAAAIMALKAGVFDVLPARSFEGLTAEDFRLLLNGVNEINVSLLQSYVTFHDESGDGAEHLSYFRRWFWWVLERMTNEEKQDLVYFWTGSPALPASEEGFQPMPSITIRPRDDMYFVTANTCISRLYIPLYTTRSILRTKLLTSIKAKSFGFI